MLNDKANQRASCCIDIFREPYVEQKEKREPHVAQKGERQPHVEQKVNNRESHVEQKVHVNNRASC